MKQAPPHDPQDEEFVYDRENKEHSKKTNGSAGANAGASIHYEWEPLELNQPYFVKNRIQRVGVGALIGRGYTGKTETVVDLVAAGSTQRNWGGARIVRPGGTVFFNAEGGKGPMRSWHAIKDLVIKPQFEHEGREMPAQFPFALVLSPPPLLKNKQPSKEAIKWYVDRIEEAKAVFAKKFGVETVLAVYETLAKIAVWKDENDNAECTNAFLPLEEIAHRTDLFCLTTDHLPKDETATKPRGGGAKYDSADSILRISVGNGEARTLHVDKVRGDEGNKEIPFRLIKVQRGVDRDGDPITAVRIAWSEEVSPEHSGSRRKGGRPPENLHHLRAAMRDAFDAGLGKWIQVPNQGAHGKHFAVPMGQTRRNYFSRAGTSGQKESSLQTTFTRTVNAAISSGDLGAHHFENGEVFYWDPQADETRQNPT